MNKYFNFVLFALLASSTIACEEQQMEGLKAAEKVENYVLFREELYKLIPVGSDEERVICVLDAIGWGYKFHKPHNMYSISKSLKGGLLLKRHVRVNVRLDNEGKVKEITVSINNTSRLG